MNCREKILSEDYMSILLDYVPEEANETSDFPPLETHRGKTAVEGSDTGN